MDAGARTPEELETLLEDAFVLHDHQALAELFQPGAMASSTGQPTLSATHTARPTGFATTASA